MLYGQKNVQGYCLVLKLHLASAFLRFVVFVVAKYFLPVQQIVAYEIDDAQFFWRGNLGIIAIHVRNVPH